MFARGEIVLVPFPFTDLSASKVRPAIIVSADPQHVDIIIAAISSKTAPNILPTEVVIGPHDADFSTSGLKKTSIFKMDKLCTLHHSLAKRKLGKASVNLQSRLDRALETALALH